MATFYLGLSALIVIAAALINDNWLYLFGLPIIATVSTLAWLLDRMAWNGGKCPCGGQWIYFDTDSQGGHGYKCSSGVPNHVVWISSGMDR